MLLVEDPFDDNDNVGRTFGTWSDPPLHLAFVSQVFESTAEVLEAVEAGSMHPGAALAWLFGPELLVDVPALCPEIFSQVRGRLAHTRHWHFGANQETWQPAGICSVFLISSRAHNAQGQANWAKQELSRKVPPLPQGLNPGAAIAAAGAAAVQQSQAVFELMLREFGCPHALPTIQKFRPVFAAAQQGVSRPKGRRNKGGVRRQGGRAGGGGLLTPMAWI